MSQENASPTTPPDPPECYPVRFSGDPADHVDLDNGHSSPEAAARGDIPEEFIAKVDIKIEGDYALVSMLTNDRQPFEAIDEAVIRIGSQWFPM